MIYDLGELILDTRDYDFKPFSHQGFGGKSKYIATPKKKNMPKLLVKHKGEYSPSCNSFIYGRVGELLGVRVPKTFIMNVAKEDRHLFESPCVVGMEFIDGLQLINIEKIKGNKGLEREFIHCFLLCGLFTRFEDNMQCAWIPGEAVYPLDFDESFGLENSLFNMIVQDSGHSESFVKMRLKNCWQHNLDICLKICVETVAEQLKISADEVISIFVETLQHFCELKEDEIVSITDALMEFFPPLLAVYYEEYIKILQEKTKAYISRNKIL